jgi:hypothetical protein
MKPIMAINSKGEYLYVTLCMNLRGTRFGLSSAAESTRLGTKHDRDGPLLDLVESLGILGGNL